MFRLRHCMGTSAMRELAMQHELPTSQVYIFAISTVRGNCAKEQDRSSCSSSPDASDTSANWSQKEGRAALLVHAQHGDYKNELSYT
eukprot:2029478-Amphidinium_carterae.1